MCDDMSSDLYDVPFVSVALFLYLCICCPPLNCMGSCCSSVAFVWIGWYNLASNGAWLWMIVELMRSSPCTLWGVLFRKYCSYSIRVHRCASFVVVTSLSCCLLSVWCRSCCIVVVEASSRLASCFCHSLALCCWSVAGWSFSSCSVAMWFHLVPRRLWFCGCIGLRYFQLWLDILGVVWCAYFVA